MTELPAATLAHSGSAALAAEAALGPGVALGAGLALGVGVLLGVVFFGGLWWTAQRGLYSRYAALWFSLSMLLRTGVTLLGFVLVARGSWGRLAICLAGFAVARLIVTRLTALAPAAALPAAASASAAVAARTSHAP